MQKRKVTALLFVSAGIWFSACSAEDELTPSLDEEDLAAESAPVHLVQVVDLEQGGKVVAWDVVPASVWRERAKRREDGTGRAMSAITEDEDCLQFGGGLLKIWDQPNRPSSGANLICFTGNGVADLTDYCRTCVPFGGGCVCTDTWDANVESFETGNRDARFGSGNVDADMICCNAACSVRQSSTAVDTASVCEQGARWVDRDLSDCSCSTDPDC